MDISAYRVPEGKAVKLVDYPTRYSGPVTSKKAAAALLAANIARLARLQDKLYAHDRYGCLIVFQAMDAAGKDGAIKHVMSGLNPQGTQVFSFKQPSAEELDHGYLWRVAKAVPERGRIGIFNRSHYEDVLVVRVHNLVAKQKLPSTLVTKDLWRQRFEQIRNFERYLSENGIVPIKFYLHLSKKEQKKRFLKRLDTTEKNWKFSAADLKERALWEDYRKCYEEAIAATSVPWAPWYIVPADRKWAARLIVSAVLVETLEALPLRYPEPDPGQQENLALYRRQLMEER
jgi:PPK2 family polyphosphate:nucleotide phosphotransferase